MEDKEGDHHLAFQVSKYAEDGESGSQPHQFHLELDNNVLVNTVQE